MQSEDLAQVCVGDWEMSGDDHAVGLRLVREFHPGASTASSVNVSYRLGKLQDENILRGRWLDFGCAEGSYTSAMVAMGADSAVGVDVSSERIDLAKSRFQTNSNVGFCHTPDIRLPFGDSSFDGAFVNEVMEHVTDEVASVRELFRVLRPGGYLAVISPNRGFPFECHGAQFGKLAIRSPVPILPWLPNRFAQRFMNARNYWPAELRDLIGQQGFIVLSVQFVWPVLEFYRWLPDKVCRWYQQRIPRFDSLPVLRRFGVSVFVLARKPE
jgi:ubiquinone/menaquinone biosynthesis C-methylase UbiE